MSTAYRFDLTQKDIPTQWYNILPDFPTPLAPPLHPGTKEPVTPDLMGAIFPMNLIMQEMSPENRIDIPEEVRDIYTLWRPTPLLRAIRLEKALDTPAHIYYKYEGVSPADRISSTPPFPRPTSTSKPAPSTSSPKPAPDSGVLPWPWPANSSG